MERERRDDRNGIRCFLTVVHTNLLYGFNASSCIVLPGDFPREPNKYTSQKLSAAHSQLLIESLDKKRLAYYL